MKKIVHIVALFFLFLGTVNAQVSSLRGIDIAGGVIELQEDQFLNTTVGATNYIGMENILRLKLEELDFPQGTPNFTIDVPFTMLKWDRNNNVLPSETGVLTIVYDAGFLKHKDEMVYKTTGAYRTRIEVGVIQNSVFPYLTKSVVLESEFREIRNYNYQLLNQVGFLRHDPVDQLTKELTFHWFYAPSASHYELEWVFINDHAIDAPVIDEKIFENATRVTTVKEFYTIAYPSEAGQLYYRVRLVAKKVPTNLTNPYFYGAWTTSDPNWVTFNEIDITEFEEDRTWVYQSVYSGNDAKGESVTYIDATGRVRQKIAKDQENDVVMVSEQAYGFNGEPMVRTLPGIAPTTQLSYFEDYTIAADGSPFSKKNYAVDSKINNPDPINPKSNTATEFHSNYFSPNNPFIGDGVHDFLPDAEGYAYNLSVFDDQGRVSKMSGLGEELKMGNSNETDAEIFYGNVSQYELDRLFGNEVGYNVHYSAEMTKDQNGVNNIRYYDLAGNIIAHAIVGDAPDNTEEIEGVTVIQKSENISEGYNVVEGTVSTLSYDFLSKSTCGTPSEFNLIFTKSDYQSTCSTQGCVYDLTFSITDNYGYPVDITVDGNTYQEYVAVIDENSFTANGNTTYEKTISADLDIAQYKITKTLSVNQNSLFTALAAYEASLRDGTCGDVSNLQTLIDNKLYETSTTLGDLECDECKVDCEQMAWSYHKAERDGHITSLTETEFKDAMKNYDPLSPFEHLWVAGKGNCVDLQSTSDPELYNQCLGSSSSQFDYYPNGHPEIAVGSIQETYYDWCYSYQCDPATRVQEPIIPVLDCRVAKRTLMADLSPGGQYFDNQGLVVGADEFNKVDQSVALNANWLDAYISNGNLSSFGWTFVDENNDNAVVPITNWITQYDNIRNNWQKDWAEDLIPYHPEYCHYSWCQEISDADQYDIFLARSTYAEVSNLASDPITISNTEINIHDNDPLTSYSPSYLTSTFWDHTLDPNINTTINKGVLNYEGSTGGTIKLFDYALNLYNTNYGQAYPLINSSAEEDEQLWEIYKRLYITLRQNFKEVMKDDFYANQNNPTCQRFIENDMHTISQVKEGKAIYSYSTTWTHQDNSTTTIHYEINFPEVDIKSAVTQNGTIVNNVNALKDETLEPLCEPLYFFRSTGSFGDPILTDDLGANLDYNTLYPNMNSLSSYDLKIAVTGKGVSGEQIIYSKTYNDTFGDEVIKDFVSSVSGQNLDIKVTYRYVQNSTGEWAIAVDFESNTYYNFFFFGVESPYVYSTQENLLNSFSQNGTTFISLDGLKLSNQSATTISYIEGDCTHNCFCGKLFEMENMYSDLIKDYGTTQNLPEAYDITNIDQGFNYFAYNELNKQYAREYGGQYYYTDPNVKENYEYQISENLVGEWLSNCKGQGFLAGNGPKSAHPEKLANYTVSPPRFEVPAENLTVPVELNCYDEICERGVYTTAVTTATSQWEKEIADKLREFEEDYYDRCINNLEEEIVAESCMKEYMYTLYYYDIEGNLRATVSPEGVDPLTDTEIAGVQSYRKTAESVEMDDFSAGMGSWVEIPVTQGTNSVNPSGNSLRIVTDQQWAGALKNFSGLQVGARYKIKIKLDMLEGETGGNTVGVCLAVRDANYNVLVNPWAKTGYHEVEFVAGTPTGNLHVCNGQSTNILSKYEINSFELVQISGSGTPKFLSEMHYNGRVLKPNSTEYEAPQTNYFEYTTLGNVSKTESPDMGEAYFYHDELGRLVASQNGEQKNENSPNQESYNYTTFDDLGRISKMGEVTIQSANSFLTEEVAENKTTAPYSFKSWLALGEKPEETTIYYDRALTPGVPGLDVAIANELLTSGQPGLTNFRNRIFAVTKKENVKVGVGESGEYVAIHGYKYDVHGRVLSYTEYGNTETTGDQEFFTTNYLFDPHSGLMQEVEYQKGKEDQLLTKYSYNANQQLKRVYTSTDDEIWHQDQKNLFYVHGGMHRKEFGHHQIQGIDLVSTIRGQVKGLNSGTLNPNRDIGRDGISATSKQVSTNQQKGLNGAFARDAAGFTVHYYDNDYKSVGTMVSQQENRFESTVSNTDILAERKSFYNGLLSLSVTAIRDQNLNASPQLNVYHYDNAYRFREQFVYQEGGANNNTQILNDWDNTAHLGGSNVKSQSAYHVNVTYDLNGNIETLKRNGAAGNVNIDDIDYHYNDVVDAGDDIRIGNQLLGVTDQGTTGGFSADNNSLNDEDLFHYTKFGSLTRDNNEGYTLEWTSDRKIKKVIWDDDLQGKQNIEFKYDAYGRRSIKILKSREQQGNIYVEQSEDQWEYVHYGKESNGRPMAIYSRKKYAIANTVGASQERAIVKINDFEGVQSYNDFRVSISGDLSYPGSNMWSTTSTTPAAVAQNLQAEINSHPDFQALMREDICAACVEIRTALPGEYNNLIISTQYTSFSVSPLEVLSPFSGGADASPVYLTDEIKLEEHLLYGGGRIGNIDEHKVLLGNVPAVTGPAYTEREIGKRNYEISNWLGSVITVYRDVKQFVSEQAINSNSTGFEGGDDNLFDFVNPYSSGWVANDGTSDALLMEYMAINPSSQYGPTMHEQVTAGDVVLTSKIDARLQTGSVYGATFTRSLRDEENKLLYYSAGANNPVWEGGGVPTSAVQYSTLAFGVFPIPVVLYHEDGSPVNWDEDKIYVSVSPWANPGTDATWFDNIELEVQHNSNGYYEPAIEQSNDYMPFGMAMESRGVTPGNGGYRYGYQGSEGDNEFFGKGKSYTTEFRQLDSRLGRWFAADPVFQPWQSPYNSMDNDPIGLNDVLGDKTEDKQPIQKGGSDDTEPSRGGAEGRLDYGGKLDLDIPNPSKVKMDGVVQREGGGNDLTGDPWWKRKNKKKRHVKKNRKKYRKKHRKRAKKNGKNGGGRGGARWHKQKKHGKKAKKPRKPWRFPKIKINFPDINWRTAFAIYNIVLWDINIGNPKPHKWDDIFTGRKGEGTIVNDPGNRFHFFYRLKRGPAPTSRMWWHREGYSGARDKLSFIPPMTSTRIFFTTQSGDTPGTKGLGNLFIEIDEQIGKVRTAILKFFIDTIRR